MNDILGYWRMLAHDDQYLQMYRGSVDPPANMYLIDAESGGDS